MPTKIRHEAQVVTGASYDLGHFSLKLNYPIKDFLELEERFHLILTLDPIPKDENILISNYSELEKSKWMRTTGSKDYFDKIPFRIPLAFKPDRNGDGYAQCDILCWAFQLKHIRNRYATLVYDKKDSRDIAIVVIRSLKATLLPGWSLRVREAEAELAKLENDRPARYILSPSAWQPEVEFGGPADLHLWRLPESLPLVDSHLHIQSNHCAPLPLVWDKLPIKGVFEFLRIGWDTQVPDKLILIKGAVVGAVGALIAGPVGSVFALGGMIANQIRLGKLKPGLDQVSGLLFGESGKIGGKPTEKIGEDLGKRLKEAKTWRLPFFSNEGPKALATPLPMDMHYGHFRGYHGEPIYKMAENRCTFRLSPFSEERGAISTSDLIAYESYGQQFKKTTSVSKAKAWLLLPLFHYDPRRWMEIAEQPESWDTPFIFVNSSEKIAMSMEPFIGFKTYTSLGYMPLDPALPHQVQFYDKCANEGIPIMNHCTTAGMYTHDKPFYYDLWKADPILSSKHTLDPEIEALEQNLKTHIIKIGKSIVDSSWKRMEKELLLKKIIWFDKHYVFPSAWEHVVKNRKSLKLCLAHFCGYDFFGTKEFKNGSTDEDTGMIYGFPETDPSNLPDAERTNPLILDLCKLVRPDNQVHFDVSFFFITEHNKEAVWNFYSWARAYKGSGNKAGFFLDRMLWGSDWPLLATDSSKGKYLKNDQLKGYVDMNAKEWMEIDPELWFRMAVVNPVRFYNLKELQPHLEAILETRAPTAYINPPLSMAETYSKRKKVIG